MAETVRQIRQDAQNRNAIAVLVEGGSVREAAAAARISPRQLRRRCKTRDFQDLLFASEPGAEATLKLRIVAAQVRAVRALIRLMKSGDARTSFAAASKTLRLADLGYEELRRRTPTPPPVETPPVPTETLSADELRAILADGSRDTEAPVAHPAR